MHRPRIGCTVVGNTTSDWGKHMATSIDSHLARMIQMCGFHQRAVGLLAADSLDRDSGVDLAKGFSRYDALCEAGDGCGR